MTTELFEVTQDLADFIKTLAPDVHVRETGAVFEDEHANLEVLAPLTWSEERCRDLQRQISGHAVDIHIETGYLILTYVCTPEQQIQEAEQTLAHAQRQLKGAERVLAEARALGLYQVSSVKSELISA